MPKAKVAVTIDRELLDAVDSLVAAGRFANRSAAVESAVAAQVARVRRTRLAEECRRLDPRAEREMAEEGLQADFADWPAY